MNQHQDLEAINRVCAAMFAVFCQDADGRVDLDAVRELFLPEAVIIKTVNGQAEIYSVDSFVKPRQVLLNSGVLKGFGETELQARTELFGHIAQRLSIYRKWGEMEGTPFQADGVKTFQFLKQAGVWRISSLSWEDESEALQIALMPWHTIPPV